MASTAGRRRPCWRRTGLCHRRTGLRITETEIGKTRAETCAPTSPAWRSLGEFSRPETLAYLSKSRKYREFSQTWRTTAPRCTGWLGHQDSNLGMAESLRAAPGPRRQISRSPASSRRCPIHGPSRRAALGSRNKSLRRPAASHSFRAGRKHSGLPMSACREARPPLQK
jgi:hypothetical protein